MTFRVLLLTADGEVSAQASGHPTEVIEAFHAACSVLLSPRGPWRITSVIGICPDTSHLDSDMMWSLKASQKKLSL